MTVEQTKVPGPAILSSDKHSTETHLVTVDGQVT
jgi:hypothetical protein